ncbi:protein NASP homolog 1-like [Impatiens glandulifera]|uniref:protein NASP homolog 1-like n=1 Tax=Impatiens glandulifera TaxID=253017 RepID=UPI001FB09230|nr:protein NASP homolog 1-like [Impatiens glandulifera]
MAKGSTALDEKDFFEAAECFSRALEIRVANFGELDKERFNAYYFYGYALLRHVLDDGTTQVSNEGGTTQAESTCVSSDVENDESSDADDSATGLNEEENDEIEIDTDDTSNNDEDEDENELDLAWQILDFARVISETRPTQSMSNVYILCALGEVNCYRDDLKTSLEDYLKASQILESLVEPNLMDRARQYFNMGLCLEVAVIIKEATLFFDKALKCCCSVLPLLVSQLCSLSSPRITLSESGEEVLDTGTISHQSEHSNLISKIEKDIAQIRDYSIMLEYKLKELDEIQNTPKASLEEAINALSNKVRQVEENVSTSSTTTSTDLQVRHFGKLGGSVKKISAGMYSDSIKSGSSK